MPSIEKQCPICSQVFFTKERSPHQIYCSKKCAGKILREKKREQISETKKQWRLKNLDKVKEKSRIYY